MKYTRIFIIGILLLAANAAAQEYRGVTLEFFVDNGEGRSQRLAAGIREGATSGIDQGLEEAELPPQPPNEIFDARIISTPGTSQLGLGSLADYRPIPSSPASERYTISYQAGVNASGVTLRWTDPLPGRITSLTIDGEDVSGQSSVESQFMTGQFVIEISFDPAPLSYEASPNPLTFMVNNNDPLPTKDLTITPNGDPSASWILETDADWLSIIPGYGEGEQTVQVSVNTQRLPAGTYQANIRVRSQVYSADLDVPVQMEMVVGVEDVPAADGLWLGQNYPNPFNPSTVIELDLGGGSRGTPATLKVHDLLGREVMDLSSSLETKSGVQRVRFDASALPGGVYSYTLRAGQTVRSRTMTLLK